MQPLNFAPSTTKDRTTKHVKWNNRFVSLPHAMIREDSFVALPASAVKLLLVMASFYNGSNNGHLTATFSALKNHGFYSKGTLTRARQDLLAAGVLIETSKAYFKKPAMFALSYYPIDPPPAHREYNASLIMSNESCDEWRTPAVAKTWETRHV